MNRIKKFNELNSQVYNLAGHKLKKLGHPTRAARLMKHSYETLKKEAAAEGRIAQTLHITNTENRRAMGYDSRRADGFDWGRRDYDDDYDDDYDNGYGDWQSRRRHEEERRRAAASHNKTLDIQGDFYYKIFFDEASFDYEMQDPDCYDLTLSFYVEVLAINANQQQEMKTHYIKQGHYGPWWTVALLEFNIGEEDHGLGEDDYQVNGFHISGVEKPNPDLQINRRMARKLKNDILDMLTNENNLSFQSISTRVESLGLSIVSFENELRYTPINALYK